MKEKPEGYELYCAAKVNLLFYHLLKSFPYKLRTEKDRSADQNRQRRIRGMP